MNKSGHRISFYVNNDTFEQLKYWSDKHNTSINDYVRDCIDRGIRFENGDYDLPTLESQRLAQILDVIIGLNSNIESLESVITSGFASLLGLAKGDNYLLSQLDNEDGDLS